MKANPTRTVANGAVVRLRLDAIGANVGSTLRFTIEPFSDDYEATRNTARRLRGHYRRTLDLLTK